MIEWRAAVQLKGEQECIQPRFITTDKINLAIDQSNKIPKKEDVHKKSHRAAKIPLENLGEWVPVLPCWWLSLALSSPPDDVDLNR